MVDFPVGVTDTSPDFLLGSNSALSVPSKAPVGTAGLAAIAATDAAALRTAAGAEAAGDSALKASNLSDLASKSAAIANLNDGVGGLAAVTAAAGLTGGAYTLVQGNVTKKGTITAAGATLMEAANLAAQKAILSTGIVAAKATYLQETMMPVGDSWMEYGLGRPSYERVAGVIPTPGRFSSQNWLEYANSYMQNRFRFISTCAKAGDVFAQILVRARDGWTTTAGTGWNPVITIPPVVTVRPDWVFIFGGINDIWKNTNTAAVMFAEWKAIYDLCANAGIKVATATIPGFGVTGVGYITAAMRTRLLGFNALLKDFCAQNAIPCVDFYATIVNPATGVLFPAWSADYTHMNQLGAQKIGLEVFRAFENIRPAYYPQRLALPWDRDHANLNPRLSGSNAAGVNGWYNFFTPADADGPDGTVVETTGTFAVANVMTVAKYPVAGGPAETTRVTYTMAGAANSGPGVRVRQTVTTVPWSSGLAVNPSTGTAAQLMMHRIQTATGLAASPPVDYLVTNFGASLAVGADPTAGWSTVLGTEFTDGTATFRVVNAIIAGTTLVTARCQYSNNVQTVAGAASVDLTLAFGDAHPITTQANQIARCSCLEGISTFTPGTIDKQGAMVTPAVVVPVGTTVIGVWATVWLANSIIGSVDIDGLEVLISTPGTSP